MAGSPVSMMLLCSSTNRLILYLETWKLNFIHRRDVVVSLRKQLLSSSLFVRPKKEAKKEGRKERLEQQPPSIHPSIPPRLSSASGRKEKARLARFRKKSLSHPSSVEQLRGRRPTTVTCIEVRGWPSSVHRSVGRFLRQEHRKTSFIVK